MLVKSGRPLGYSRSIQPMCENQKPRRAEYGILVLVIHVQVMACGARCTSTKALFCSAMVPKTRRKTARPVRLVGLVRPQAVIAGSDADAIGQGKEDRHHPVGRRVNPCVNPYQGTTVSANTMVIANIRAFVTFSGGRGSEWAIFRHGRPRNIGGGAVTYHAGALQVGLASFLGMLPPQNVFRKS